MAPLNLKKLAAAGRAKKRRQTQRDRIWSNADDLIFPTEHGGWCQMPRTIPLIATLIDMLGGKDHAGRLYLTLWSYEYGDGLVEIPDPALVGMEAGYTASRAERTFEERMISLERLGFIKSSPLGHRKFGHVLLLDPHNVVAELKHSHPKAIPESWWSAYVARADAVGIQVERQSGENSTPTSPTDPPTE